MTLLLFRTYYTLLYPSVPRVRTGPGKPGKSWNFTMHFPGLESPGKGLLVLESVGNLLNSSKKYEMYGTQQGELKLRSWE